MTEATQSSETSQHKMPGRWMGPLAGMVVGILAASVAFSIWVRQSHPQTPAPSAEEALLDGELTTDSHLGPVLDPESILRMAETLGLNRTQIERIQAIDEASAEQATKLRQDMAVAAADMDVILNASKDRDIPKETRAEAAEDLERATEAYNRLRKKRWDDSVAVLNKEQKKALDEIRAREWKSTLNRLRLTEEETR